MDLFCWKEYIPVNYENRAVTGAALLMRRIELLCWYCNHRTEVLERLEWERTCECYITAGVVRILSLVMVCEYIWAARAAIDILLSRDTVRGDDVESYTVEALDEVVNLNSVTGKSSGKGIRYFGSYIAVATL